jgi:hypothetical protein
MAVAPALLAALPPSDDLVVNAMDLGGEVLVGELHSTVADDDVANRQHKQTSHFKGVRTVFDGGRTPVEGNPIRTGGRASALSYWAVSV